MKRGLRLALAATLLALAPVGCAATDEVVESPSPPLTDAQASERLLPVETTAALQACLTEGVSRLSHHAYDLSFEVQVTQRGTIQLVEVENGRLDVAGVEACLLRALEAMPLKSNNPPRGVTGGYGDEVKCARGLVSMQCGGNSVDLDGQPARPGRRT